MFDVAYRVLPDGDWRRYGVALPLPRAEAFAKALMTSRNECDYEAKAVSLEQSAAAARRSERAENAAREAA